MSRPTRVPWLLLLLFVLGDGRQRWGAGAEERTGAHSPARTGQHFLDGTEEHGSAQRETLRQDDSTGRKLKEKTTVDENIQKRGSDPTAVSGGVEEPEDGPNSNSSLADFPCPDAAAIAPCVCSVDADNNIDLDCTLTETEEQLQAVFMEHFPVKALHGFYMANNSAIRGLGNILNGVTFQKIDLYPGPFSLQFISEYFLLDSRLTLNYIRIQDSELLSVGFPFGILIALENLVYLEVRISELTWITNMNSLIETLYFTYGSTEVIETGTFSIGPGPQSINLYYNQIHTVEPGSFTFADQDSADSNEQLIIQLGGNQLQSLQAGSVPLRNAAVSLHFYRNLISSIEPRAFVLPAATDSFSLYLQLQNNQLTTFDEAVFGDLLPFIKTLYLYGNPLFCECDIAWLVTNETYIAKVDDEATCADGRNLHELNPQDYVDFC